jgi:hypothetical protein
VKTPCDPCIIATEIHARGGIPAVSTAERHDSDETRGTRRGGAPAQSSGCFRRTPAT